MFSCLCKHLGVQLCQQDPVTIVENIPVTTDGRELCLLVRLIQRAGKWFSSSLALGTDIVADITDMLLSDRPCYRDRTRCQPPLSTFNPHGGPITHSSTGSKPDSPVHPCSQSYSSHVDSYVIQEPPSCDLFCYQMQYLFSML